MAKNEKEQLNYGKFFLVFSLLYGFVLLLKLEVFRWLIGFLFLGAAVLFFIYVVFIRMFIIYGRKR